MSESVNEPPDNLVQLDMSAFSRTDVQKIVALGQKLRLLYRWYRCERKSEPGRDVYYVYSGARGRAPYAAFRFERRRDGRYLLLDGRSGEPIAEARTLDGVIGHLPDSFYYST